MLTIIIVGILILTGIVILVAIAMRELIPKDIFIDKHSPSTAPLMRCRHCNEVVTRKNRDQHGRNCPQKK